MYYSVEISGGCAGPRVAVRIFLNVNILHSISIRKSSSTQRDTGRRYTVETKLLVSDVD